MVVNKIFVIFTIIVLSVSLVVAGERNGTYQGGEQLIHIQKARTLDYGEIVGYARIRGYSGSFLLDSSRPNIQPGETVGLSVAVFESNLNWAVTNNLEFNYAVTLYQDTNVGEANIPGMMFAGLKFGKIGIANNLLNIGIAAGVRLASADISNVIFETYASPKVGFSFLGMLSYFKDPLFPDDAYSVSINVGMIAHSDGGGIIDPPSVRRPQEIKNTAQELIFGFGFEYPSESFDLLLDIHGNSFLQEPEPFIYGQESYIYLTPGFRYKMSSLLNFDISVDLLVSDGKDATQYASENTTDPSHFSGANTLGLNTADIPNYPSWRLNIGTQFTILPPREIRKDPSAVRERKRKKQREVLEQIILEEEETQSAEEELERLRKQRKESEKELERIRRILQSGGGI